MIEILFNLNSIMILLIRRFVFNGFPTFFYLNSIMILLILSTVVEAIKTILNLNSIMILLIPRKIFMLSRHIRI